MASHIIATVAGHAGLITLDRPRALNALSLTMVRDLSRALWGWRDDPAIDLVAIRGKRRDSATGLESNFGAFCAGGDIRFFHQAALAGNPKLEDFFTEEYRLNHLIHHYPKPVLAFMDGIVMGGGMGVAQGASLRIATERTRMAMPETNIGLFPDVGGGYFLSRCPGHMGEYLALTGHLLGGAQAVAVGLADGVLASRELDRVWSALANLQAGNADNLQQWIRGLFTSRSEVVTLPTARIDHFFGLPTMHSIIEALEAVAATDNWARDTALALRQRSPLMLHVTLEQIRRARVIVLADDLRMERDLVRHSFHPQHLGRSAASSDTTEGIRALAIDKDLAPRWSPARIEDVTPDMVLPFFDSPWPAQAHPLRDLD